MERFQSLIQSVLRIEQYIREWTTRPHTCPQCSPPGLPGDVAPQPLPDPDNLMDAGEVMTYLRISRTTFFRLKKEGILPCRRIRGRDYFPRSGLEEALKLSILKGRL